MTVFLGSENTHLDALDYITFMTDCCKDNKDWQLISASPLKHDDAEVFIHGSIKCKHNKRYKFKIYLVGED